MGLLNSKSRFLLSKKMTVPVYKVPKNLQQSVPISRIAKNGVFEIERTLAGERMYDKVYSFTDINYVSKDMEEQNQILQTLIKILKTMNANFKFIIANHNRNMERFRKNILYEEAGNYGELAAANNEFILDSLKKGRAQINQIKYLVVTCYRQDFENANTYFNTLEASLTPLFMEIRSALQPLDAAERLRCLHDIYRLGREEDYTWTWEDYAAVRRDWRSDIVPSVMEIQEDNRSIHLGDNYVSVLFAIQYSNRLDETKVVKDLTNGINFHTITTLDISPMEQLVVKEKLEASLVNNEMAIAREQDKKNQQGAYSSNISFPKRKKSREIEEYLEQIDENDESGYMMGMLVAVYGQSREQLKSNVEQIITIGRQDGIIFEPYDHKQLEAFHTCLPLGAREVDNMRCMLTTSMLAVQPFHAQEIMEDGGIVYGINETSKNPVIGNRKKLKNANGVIVGTTGSGKSMEVKLELGQVVVSTGDDVIVIDPQGEYKEFCELVGGQFIEFSSESRNYFNFLEIPETMLGSDDEHAIREFIGQKTDIATAVSKEAMMPRIFDGNHLTIVNRCIRLMYEQIFCLPAYKQKSPTLFDFRRILSEQPEKEAGDIYTPLETFTEGSLNMFAHPSNVDIENRIVVFGMNSVPPAMRRMAMLIVIHILTQRVEYNQKAMKATWFVVDEAQEVYSEELGAQELDRAFRTFRKKGGINTMITQNISTALHNERVKDMISNSEFKLFLDQGGADRNAIAQILDLSSDELLQLTNSKAGTGVLVYGKKVVKLNGRLSADGQLYKKYSTNFHEKQAEKQKENT